MKIYGSDKHGISYIIYIMLFLISFSEIYLNNNIINQLTIIIIIIYSYYLLIFKNVLFPAICLALYSRCINGIISESNKFIFYSSIIATLLLPFIIFSINQNVKFNNAINLIKYNYKYTFFYIIWLFIYILPDPVLGSQMIMPRIVPLVMFIIAVSFIKKNFEYHVILSFFRITTIASIAMYYLTNYSEITYKMLSSGIIFGGKEEYDLQTTILDYFRLMGIYFDPRIFGLFSVLYGTLSFFLLGNKFRIIDIVISMSSVILSTSRGAIFLYILILIAYFYNMSNKIFYIFLKYVFYCVFISLIAFTFKFEINDDINSFVRILNIVDDDNLVSQRSGFFTYAIDKFIDNPIGSGNGSLKGHGPSRAIDVGGYSYDDASDAYLAILPAEVGFIGFILFILSFIEILPPRNPIGIALFFGLLVEMIGTDIPDMGIFYFIFMYISNRILNDIK